MSSITDSLMTAVGEPIPICCSKITVVGTGQVGMACAFSILAQEISSEICLVDSYEEKLFVELWDLEHASHFLGNPRVTASTNYEATKDSQICIVAAGVRQNEGESRLELVQRNTDVLKNIIPDLVKYNPNTILLIVSNPVDLMTYVAWKLSGFPKNRVIGSGTNLDSSRFRFLLSQKLNVAPTACDAWVIGEHGDSSVPVWSGVNIAGVRLRDLNPCIGIRDDEEGWNQLHNAVLNSAYEIIACKGFTSWAIGSSVAAITNEILKNTNRVVAVSTSAKGYHGIEKEVFLSLPCVVGTNGITSIVKQILTNTERSLLQKSADLLHETQIGLLF